MHKRYSPTSIAAPASAYAHGVEAVGATRWLHISGQLGQHADGTLAEGTAAQMEVCWQRILTVLSEAGMTREHLVKITAYLTNADEVGLYRDIRDRYLEGQETASTLLVVSALAHPDWTVEIEAVAAA